MGSEVSLHELRPQLAPTYLNVLSSPGLGNHDSSEFAKLLLRFGQSDLRLRFGDLRFGDLKQEL